MRAQKIGTMEDSRAVGLSRPTVSVLPRLTSVRAKTRQDRGCAEAIGVPPNIFAVNLNRRRTKIIGLIIRIRLIHFATLARRIETEPPMPATWRWC